MSTEKTKQEHLLPCPFCGGIAVSSHQGLNDAQKRHYGEEVVGCLECDIWLDNAEEWNTRIESIDVEQAKVTDALTRRVHELARRLCIVNESIHYPSNG